MHNTFYRFSNEEHIEVVVWQERYFMAQSIVSKALYDPHVHIIKCRQARRCNRKYWKSQNLNFTDQLKEVTVVLSNRFNGMELARYILEQANLEKMVIFYLPHQSYVIKKVKPSKMAFTATIVFHIKTAEMNHEVQSRFCTSPEILLM
ncbi:unnamed protein product [Prunus armeniaca]